MMLIHALLSDAFFLFLLPCLEVEEAELGRDILGKEDGGGELDGGSNRSDKSLPEPGEKGESLSRSMSIGEENADSSVVGS